MSKKYCDFELIKKYPNKYNLTPKSIKKLKVLDWERLKKYTWYNQAKKATGDWWCHLEGSQVDGQYNDFCEFWIGFNEKNNRIDCHFSTMEGMCHYIFDEFYKDIENKYELQMQVNTIKYLNMLIDEVILGI